LLGGVGLEDQLSLAQGTMTEGQPQGMQRQQTDARYEAEQEQYEGTFFRAGTRRQCTIGTEGGVATVYGRDGVAEASSRSRCLGARQTLTLTLRLSHYHFGRRLFGMSPGAARLCPLTAPGSLLRNDLPDFAQRASPTVGIHGLYFTDKCRRYCRQVLPLWIRMPT
jgi:uncharacterized protein RhaS with RHS repeats